MLLTQIQSTNFLLQQDLTLHGRTKAEGNRFVYCSQGVKFLMLYTLTIK